MKAWDSLGLENSNKTIPSIYPTLPSMAQPPLLEPPPSTRQSRPRTPLTLPMCTTRPQQEERDLIGFPTHEWHEFDPILSGNNTFQNYGGESFNNVFDSIYDSIYPKLPKPVATSSPSLYGFASISESQSSTSLAPPSVPYLVPPPPSTAGRSQTPQGSPSRSMSLLGVNGEHPPRSASVPYLTDSLRTDSSESAQLSSKLYASKFVLTDEPEEKDVLRFVEKVSQVRAYGSDAKSRSPIEILYNRRVNFHKSGKFTSFLPNVTVEILRDESSAHGNVLRMDCDVNGMNAEVLTNAAVIHFYDSTECSQFYLRIRGRMEYLENCRKLAEHDYIVQCCRYERPLTLVLDHESKISAQFKRAVHDSFVPFTVEEATRSNAKTFLTKQEMQACLNELLVKGSEVERVTVNSATTQRQRACSNFIKCIVEFTQRLGNIAPEDLLRVVNVLQESLQSDYLLPSNLSYVMYHNMERIYLQLVTMVRCYCRLKRTPYTLPLQMDSPVACRSSEDCKELFRVRVLSLHRYQPSQQRQCRVYVELSLYFAGRPLQLQPENVFSPWFSSSILLEKVLLKEFPPFLSSYDWINFTGNGGNFTIQRLPRETMLYVQVWSDNAVGNSGGNVTMERRQIGWAQLPIFDVDCRLCQGVYWVGLWAPGENKVGEMTCTTNPGPDCPLVVLQFEEFDCSFVFPPQQPDNHLDVTFGDFSNLEHSLQSELLRLVRMAWFLHDREFITSTLRNPESASVLTTAGGSTQYSVQLVVDTLWKHRTRLMDQPNALVSLILVCMMSKPTPVVQQGWTWAAFMAHIYSLMQLWQWPDPVLALRLLCVDVPDVEIRRKACQWLARAQAEDLIIHLPEIMQCVKADTHLDWSGLCEVLLEKCLESTHFANALYWQLKECRLNSCHSQCLQNLFAALLRCCDGLCQVWREQEEAIEKLTLTAKMVKTTKNAKDRHARESALEEGLGELYDLLQEKNYRERNAALRLPFDLGLGAQQVDVKSCGVFSSFTLPLRIVFRNFDPTAAAIPVIFKSGDDLRKDRFITNMVMLMDRIWLENGLDLNLVHYRVLYTSCENGLIELVTECCTLRKIQETNAPILRAAFDEQCIDLWLRKQCQEEQDYQKAVEAFLKSSAGCCVYTYLLGIGDRHNDNIMIKTTGQMFHIDFAKVLGDFQKFAGVNRDRVLFVFMPCMAHVLESYVCPEEGGASGRGMQVFIDTCCKAYNILRGHFYQLYTILQLAATFGIDGVDNKSIQYFMGALRLHLNPMEATAAFTKDLRDSLNSMSTQLNHLIHALAGAKSSSVSEGALFRFTPRVHTISMDGRISRVEVGEYCERGSAKGFQLHVYRDYMRHPTSLWRHANDFEEFARLLRDRFKLEGQLFIVTEPLLQPFNKKSSWDPATTSPEIHARRDALQKFVNTLLNLAPEISECDAVYTFFHTSPADETTRKSLRAQSEIVPPPIISDTMELKIDMELSRNNKNVQILVKVANNLRISTGEPLNTYVKCYLRPRPSFNNKKKTKTVPGANPAFNETLDYQFPMHVNHSGYKLWISVWQKRSVGRNAILGYQLVNLSDLHPGTVSSLTLKLVPATDSNCSELNVASVTNSNVPLQPGAGWDN